MKAEIREVREVIREEGLVRDKILNVLAPEPLTIPEIAQALGYPAHEVMIWVMGLRRYGQVAETELTDEGYYKYGLAAKEGK